MDASFRIRRGFSAFLIPFLMEYMYVRHTESFRGGAVQESATVRAAHHDRVVIDTAERIAPLGNLTVEVTVSGLTVAADIGVYAHEHGRAQPLVVDIALAIDPPAHDVLAQTVDYQRVAEEAHALARGRTALIEIYAMRLAERCLAFPGVQSAEVRVSKAGALRGGLAGTRVTLTRRD